MLQKEEVFTIGLNMLSCRIREAVLRGRSLYVPTCSSGNAILPKHKGDRTPVNTHSSTLAAPEACLINHSQGRDLK